MFKMPPIKKKHAVGIETLPQRHQRDPYNVGDAVVGKFAIAGMEAREALDATLLGIDLSTLIEKLEKGSL